MPWFKIDNSFYWVTTVCKLYPLWQNVCHCLNGSYLLLQDAYTNNMHQRYKKIYWYLIFVSLDFYVTFNMLSIMSERVFLGWTSDRLELMCLVKGTDIVLIQDKTIVFIIV